MLKYELAKQLKEAWFEQEGEEGYYLYSDLDEDRVNVHLMGQTIIPEHLKDNEVYEPTLSELIEACGESFGVLEVNYTYEHIATWKAYGDRIEYDVNGIYAEKNGKGSSPEEAVARLWLSLKKNTKIS